MPVTKNTAAKGYKKLIKTVRRKVTEETITKISIIGQSNAAALTPIETSNLINSQYRNIEVTSKGFSAKVGYTASYARAVHESPGTLMGKPRSSVSSFTAYKGTDKETTAFSGNQGNFWDPDAEPKFLKKGFERDGKDEIQRTIESGYRL